MHDGSAIDANELIEFGNKLAIANTPSKKRNEEKDVLPLLALMGEMIANQRLAKRRNNEDAKLIAEESVLEVKRIKFEKCTEF